MILTPEPMPIADLRPHPRNYRSHPPDQIEHLKQSIQEHRLYRNVVVAEDNTILAGHGIVQAARELGITEVAVIRLPLAPDDPKALKVLAGDNELGRLAEVDDRLLTEMLREISEFDTDGLLGTGFDDQMLASLLFVTRSAHEIGTMDVAAEWVGMPDYESEAPAFKVIINCPDEATRTRFIEEFGLRSILTVTKNGQRSGWWPSRGIHHDTQLRYESTEADVANDA